MLVRIRFGAGPKVAKRRGKNRRLAAVAGSLLAPAGAVSLMFALWRLAADLNWTNSFAIASGLFSHWQVWMGAAGLLQLCAHMLNRYGRGSDEAAG
jgi:hypothetical protein